MTVAGKPDVSRAARPAGVTRPGRPGRPSRAAAAQRRAGAGMTAPFLALFAVFFVAPLVYSIWLSLNGRRHRPVRRPAQLPLGHQQRRVLGRRAADDLLRGHPGDRDDRASHRAGPVPGQRVLQRPEVLRAGVLPALCRARRDRRDHVGLPARTRPQRRAEHPARARPGQRPDQSAGLPAGAVRDHADRHLGVRRVQHDDPADQPDQRAHGRSSRRPGSTAARNWRSRCGSSSR